MGRGGGDDRVVILAAAGTRQAVGGQGAVVDGLAVAADVSDLGFSSPFPIHPFPPSMSIRILVFLCVHKILVPLFQGSYSVEGILGPGFPPGILDGPTPSPRPLEPRDVEARSSWGPVMGSTQACLRAAEERDHGPRRHLDVAVTHHAAAGGWGDGPDVVGESARGLSERSLVAPLLQVWALAALSGRRRS